MENTNLTPRVFLASGTWGLGDNLTQYISPEELRSAIGALVTKGLSFKPMPGNPPSRLYETPCGHINSIALENPGLEASIRVYWGEDR